MTALRMLYFSYVHSVIVCGIISWGKAPNSIKIFRMQNVCVCYNQLEENGLMWGTVWNTENTTILLLVYIYSTWWTTNSYLQITQKSITTTLDPLIIFIYPFLIQPHKKGAHYSGIKMFNCVATHIKCVANDKQVCKPALKKFLLSSSFYSVEEHFNFNK
jgi:hypothetical protein